MSYDYVIFASYGNDSIALIEWARQRGLESVAVVYSDTGWAANWWADRVTSAESWVRSIGFDPHRTKSIGMAGLVAAKKAWPRGGGGKFQFCTQALKKAPALEWLAKNDPEFQATCMTGVRREESANRRDAPEHITESPSHGGRELWQPLVRHTAKMRDELLESAGFDVLPYRSKECYPCVNATRQELRHLSDDRIIIIRGMESSAGINGAGNHRVMFSPAHHHGAVGIDAVIEDCKHGHDELFSASTCDGGWCGS